MNSNPGILFGTRARERNGARRLRRFTGRIFRANRLGLKLWTVKRRKCRAPVEVVSVRWSALHGYVRGERARRSPARIVLCGAMLLVALLCGCFKTKDELTLEADGSGKVRIETRTSVPAE